MRRILSARAADRRRVLLVFAFVTFAVNLRGPITAISPVIADIRADLGIDVATAGLLTTLPVLCFSLATPFAAWLLARVGIEAGVLLTLGGLGAGTILRAVDGFATALAGTALIGVSITIGNIVALMIIMRDFYRQRRMMTGVDVFAMSLGAMACAGFTAPIAAVAGWRFAIAVWAALALLSALLWLRLLRRPAPPPEDVPPAPPHAAPPVWRRAMPWLLGITFGGQTFLFYGLTAWLPRYLGEAGGLSVSEAGYAAALFQILGLAGSFGVPLLMGARVSRFAPLVSVALAWLAMPLGLLAAPGWWPLWVLCGGYASGGGFAVIFTLIMERARGQDDNRRIAAFVQGVGYLIAAASPTLVGYAVQVSGSWVPGFLLLAAMALAIAASGAAAIARK